MADSQLFLILMDNRSNKKIAKDYNVSPDTINRIKLGKRKTNKDGV